MNDERDRVFSSSLAAALLLALLCTLTLVSGVSQQWFERVRPVDVYTAALLHDAVWLRTIIAIDDVFIAAYVSATVLFATRLARGRFGPLHLLVIAGGVIGGVLDLEENHHLLALLASAQQGIAIEASDILRRSDLSQLKWMLGHLAFVLVGVSIEPKSSFDRAFRTSLVAVQLPIGALAWAVSSDAWDPVLLWARYAGIFAGFALIAWTHRPRINGPQPAAVADDEAGSGAPG